MSAWDGFATIHWPLNRDILTVAADYAGPDEDPVPLVSLRQKVGTLSDNVELTEEQLRWLVDEVAPKVLKRMGERP